MKNTRYIITGVKVDGQRFKTTIDNVVYASGINLFRGSVWEVDKDNKRHLLKRVYN